MQDEVYDVGGVLFPAPVPESPARSFRLFPRSAVGGASTSTPALLGLRLTEEVRMADQMPAELSFMLDGVETSGCSFTT